METKLTPQQQSSSGTTHHHDDHGIAHAVPPVVLLSVFSMLIALTILTVALTNVELGAWEIWVSMGIATAKASLVALYFMHLRYDNPLNGLILITSLIFVALFIGITLMDSDAILQWKLP
jgi:cytochrome c oxidase subunit 4